jgi:hypothetical protein
MMNILMYNYNVSWITEVIDSTSQASACYEGKNLHCLTNGNMCNILSNLYSNFFQKS